LVGALVGEIVAARVPEHVGPDPAELGFLAGQADDVVDGTKATLRWRSFMW